MSVPRLSTKRPVAVCMLVLAVVLLGVISYLRLPIDLLPDVSFPRMVVHTSYPDVAPAEIERLVTERVEAQVAAVPGVEKVTSVSQEGVSLVTLRFAWGTDMDFAALNVRERLDNLRDVLPETAGRPTILRVDPQSEPVLTVSVTGGRDLWQTKEIAETVFRRRLEQLDGIAQASVTGGLDREIQVDVDPALLEAYGVSLSEVSRALDLANYSAPGGTILRGRYRYPLRTLGEFETVDQINDVVVAREQSGGIGRGAGVPDSVAPERVVRVADVATVVDGFGEREAIARYDGTESVGLLVFKEAGANTVAVSDDVAETLELLREQYPEFTLEIASNQATFISESISNVAQALVLGGMLAFVILFFFLRDPRYPVAVALAIPISVIGTFALMEAFGVTLNIMSLGGLALGVGMLVDNSIIVLENIFRHRQAGMGALEAAAKGAEEVQGAITASTLTTISVFGPIVYVQGVAGELFGALSMAVAFSLLASLAVALTLLPTMAAHFTGGKTQLAPAPDSGASPTTIWGRTQRAVTWLIRLPFVLLKGLFSLLWQLLRFWGDAVGRGIAVVFSPLLRLFDRGFDVFAKWYHVQLSAALDRRALVLTVAAAALGGSLALAAALDRDLLPNVDQGAFDVRLELPEGTSLEATALSASDIERSLLDDPEVGAVFSRIGRDVKASAAQGEASGVNAALLQVLLDDQAVTETVVRRAREIEGVFPPGALSFETGQATALGQILGGSEADIAIRLRGEELNETYAFAQQVRSRLADVAEVRNVRIGSERGQPQFQVTIDRDAAARYKIEPRVIAETIGSAMLGDRATEFVDFDRKIAVMVRYPDQLRHDASTLGSLRVNGTPLRELVSVRETVGPAEIHREDQGRVVTVYADVASGGLADAISVVENALFVLEPPAGFAGRGRRRERGNAPLLPRSGVCLRTGAALGLHDSCRSVRVVCPPLHDPHGGALGLGGGDLGACLGRAGAKHDEPDRSCDSRRYCCQRCHRQGGLHQPSARARLESAQRDLGGRRGQVAAHHHDHGNDRLGPHADGAGHWTRR